jgi:alpha-L-rhamnosidase
VWLAATALLCVTAFQSTACAGDKTNSLVQGFENPPDSAKPRVWWHWMNGNITKEGIKLDLEWMHRIGLGGFQNFDASLDTPQVVEKRLAYMRPEWKDAFKYAIELGDQLGMEEAIASSPGWSETGGPWVPPAQGMKKYVWSETAVEGGRPFTGILIHPPTTTGLFQNMGEPNEAAGPHFYADAAVLAFRRLPSEVNLQTLQPKVTASSGAPNIDTLNGASTDVVTKLSIPAGESPAWIQFEFAEPQSVRSLTIATKDLDIVTSVLFAVSNPKKFLEASDDGLTYRVVQSIPEDGAPEHTVSFPAVKAKFFRVAFRRAPPPKTPSWMMGMDPAALGGDRHRSPEYIIRKLVLHGGPRVNRFEEKAAFATLPDLYSLATPAYGPGEGIPSADVVDLTSKLRPDGSLDWNPPEGAWIVLRFGYSLLGTTNHPATAEATGLEVDKLNSIYVKNYMDGFLASYEDTVGKEFMGKRGIRYVVTDSWEAGSQNWTDDILAKFKARRGYDALRWMPVLAGYVVDSSEASDRFLWDFRKTIADLIADEHYGQVQASLAERGIGHYGESHEGGRAYVADGMEVKKLDDIPMSAMWTQRLGQYSENYNYNADDRESASVAHIYGQNLAAAESMTASGEAWAWSPSTLKPTADAEFLNGINRIVIHESAHQPLVGKAPGLTLGPFGQWFNRNETWAEEAGPWIKYLARTSYVLQQGHFAADLLYYYGEDSNLTAIFTAKAPPVPQGYGFDYINADGLIHELEAGAGRITTKSGMSYRLLGLDPYSQHMSLPVLRAIFHLVETGGIVAGPKPTDDPSLADDQAEFVRLSDQLFGNGTGIHEVGTGRVYAGQALADVFKELGVIRDFDYSRAKTEGGIQFVHRRLADGDAYFLDNRSNQDAHVDGYFRVTGKAPELWHAETGTGELASYSIDATRTTVPLRLEPWGTVFVVFRKDTQVASVQLPPVSETTLDTLSGPWDVAFQAGRGAPPSLTLETLGSWSSDETPGVKYFSGTGTYTKTLEAPQEWLARGGRIWIDLGDVKNLAEVSLNGKLFGTLWHAPYRVDVTDAIKAGQNQLSVKVTNAWVNRLIGDEQPGGEKYTFADIKPYKANSPLLASGLIGPVRIIAQGP